MKNNAALVRIIAGMAATGICHHPRYDAVLEQIHSAFRHADVGIDATDIHPLDAQAA